MKKTILFLGLVMILTGCGSEISTTETEATTEMTTESIIENNKESVSSEIIELWKESRVFVTYDDSISVMFTFPEENSTRQFYDYIMTYLMLDKKYDDFSIISIIDGEQKTYSTIKSNGEITSQTMPTSWYALVSKQESGQSDEEYLEKVFSGLASSDMKSDLKIITDTIEDTIKKLESENAEDNENIWETIEPVEIWEGNTVRMYFDNGNPNVLFEFTDNDVARQVYNFFTIYNALKASQDTFSIFASIDNDAEGSTEDLGEIVYLNGESILRKLPDSWERFIDENKINDKTISIENSVSEDIQKSDQQKLMEAINNAAQQ